MRKYAVGYYNKAWNKSDFVVLATMDSWNVAMFVRDSYNDGYKRAGLSTEAVILEKSELPRGYRFSE